MAEKKKAMKEKKQKPIDKWTIKELREEAFKIPSIQGVHGMNKEELIEILRDHLGLPKPEKKKSGSVRDVKKKVLELKHMRDEERSQGATRARLAILRRKISRLKKKTRV
ncbi:transcription termination factor Rho [Thermodesulfobacteriota bacterium]